MSLVNIKLIGVDVGQIKTLLEATQGTYLTFAVEEHLPTSPVPTPAPAPAPSKPEPVPPSRRKERSSLGMWQIAELIQKDTRVRSILLRPEGATVFQIAEKLGTTYDIVYRALKQLELEKVVVPMPKHGDGNKGTLIYRFAPVNSAA